SMDRTYLYVPPEERAAVSSAGAHWDDRLKCWYIEPGDDPARFAQWLGIDHEVELSIISDHAHVAAATVPCCGCARPIEVICIYCETGTVSGEPLTPIHRDGHPGRRRVSGEATLVLARISA